MSSEVRDIHALQCRIGNKSQECAAVTCATIPILPLRYSAHPCPPNLPSYSYQNKKELLLERNFPPLLHMQYDLRHVGGGLIYLFNESNGKISLWQANEDGTFSALVSGHCSLGSKLEDYKFGDKKSWLWVEKDSLVHIVLTDQLLTRDKLIAIQKNINGIRDKLATTINLRDWNAENPSKDTFPASRIGELVEEYRQPDELDFSPRRAFLRPQTEDAPQKTKEARQKAKEAAQEKAKALVASAGTGSVPIAAVMCDNIALVQDIKGVIYEEMRKLVCYTSPPDDLDKFGIKLKPEQQRGMHERYRRKIIASLIEQVYENVYARKKEIEDPAKLEERIQKDIEKDVEKNKESKRSMHARRSDIFKAQAENYVNNIQEKVRVKFLEDFDAKVEELHIGVVRYKNDRFQWLDSYSKTNSRTQLGATFLRYDTDGEEGNLPPDKAASRTFHAHAFASCIDSMVWGVELSDVVRKEQEYLDKERECFAKWWETKDSKKNPVLINMGYDNGADDRLIAWGLYVGNVGGVPLGVLDDQYQKAQEAARKAQEEVDAAVKKAVSEAKNASPEVKKAGMAVNKAHQALKQAKAAEKAAAVAQADARAAQFMATEQLLGQTRVYIVSLKSAQGKIYGGQVRRNVVGYIRRLVNDCISEANIEGLLQQLREKYEVSIEPRAMTSEDVRYCLENALESRVALVRGPQETGEIMEVLVLQETGADELKKAIHDAQKQKENVQKLEEKLNAEKQKTKAAASGIKNAKDELALAKEASKKAEQNLKKLNPFCSHVNSGFSAAMTALAFWNLKNVADTLARKRNKINVSALAAAIAGLCGALNALAGTRWAKNTVQQGLRHPLAVRGYAAIAGIVALRVFGYGAAVLDGITFKLRASEQFEAGNERAGNLYNGAAIGFLLGESAITAGTSAVMVVMASKAVGVVAALATPLLGIPVWGWIVVGALALGVGIYCSMRGDDAKFDPMSYWLDACVFGRHEISGINGHKGLEAELKAFHNAAFGPQLTDENWDGIPASSLKVTFVYPLPGSGHKLTAQGNSLLGSGQKLTLSVDLEETQFESSGLRKHVYQIEKLDEIEELTLVASYVPDNSTLGTLTLEHSLKK